MCKKLLIFVLMLGLVSTAIGQPTGEIMREVWEGIGGTAVEDLTGNAAYPDNPTYADLVTSLEAPSDFADNFGSRMHGWLYPATSGDYTFWIAADDFCQLWLSTDDDPANALQICGHNSWTGSRDFDSMPEQMSEPVALEAGGKYYIMALYKEGGGGDNCAAAWQGPDSPERSVIDGAFLSPAAWAPSTMKAKNPVPADGAVDVDTGILEWGAGALAVSHVVYLNDELLGETELGMELMAATLDPGVTYTWRVDEVQEDGTVIEGNTWTLTTLPLEAHFPSPADGAENVPSPVTLSWTPGKNTIINTVYFGTDEALVAAGDTSTSQGQLVSASCPVGDVELFTTYYWKVDELTPAGPVPGPVWSFSTEKYVLIEDSLTLEYDNSAEPYVSEAAIDTIADLTAGGAVSDLTLSFQGMAGNLSVDEDTGTYTITGEGADIWGNTDAFHYVYMQLTGDGEISARVVSNGTGSNAWAKGGVMIRETNAHDSKHMIMALTGGEGGGIGFQGRAETGGASSSYHGDVTAAPPTWVKISRVGNDITGSYSADGVEWTPMTDASPDDSGGFGISNPQTVEMADPVLVGLFVTSHADGENRTFVFDNVDIQGDVDGVIVSEDIASVSGNSAEPIYIALEDLTGAVAAVTHPYAAATQLANRAWTIPLAAFEGVDATQAAKLYVGVGDGEPGGKGAITVSDIKVVEAAPAGPEDVTAPGDIVQGVPNDGLMDGDDWGWPGAETPDLAIDDNTGTKFLHFRGDLMPTGIRVTPLDGPSVVTGIALTTANDAPNRDPVTYQLSGSNESIDGPYELIAEGDIVDFAGEAEWPRFTKNAMPITFANDTAYAHYELVFPDVRNPDADNSMQIAEIELLEGAGILRWEAAAAADSPGYLATSVPLGVYDIGTYGGEQTYEFVVNSNPDETAVSMALIGRHGHGDTTAALKFDQWNDTGEYGATIFGVVDLYYGIANNPGVDTHLAFVSSEAAGTTELYIDGALAGSVDGAISLSGAVGIGGANRDPEGAGWVDPFDGDILGVAIYDAALSADQIAAHADAFFMVDAASAPTIAWVSYHAADDEPHADAAGVGFTQAPDIEYTDLLKAQGYNVVRVVTSKEPDVEFLNTMDLVIISRTASSGHYGGSGASLWNSVTTPTINLNGYTLRSSRMGFTDGTDMPDTTGDIRLAVTDPAHPIFAGIALTDGVMDNPYAEGAVPLPTDETIISRGISINNNTIDDDGTLLATIAEVSADAGPVGGMVIAEWPAGATMQNSSGSPDDVLGGPRLVFLTGSREPSGVTGGQAAALYDLYEDGTQMFLNAVEYMLP